MRLMQGFEQDSKDWHKWREGGIGSSDIGSIIGVNPYESAKTAWAKKTKFGGVTKFDNEHTARGKLWEPKVRDYYSNLMGTPFEPVCIMSDTKEWARVSLDGRRADGKLIIEIKCPTSENWQKIKAQNYIHAYWRAQIEYQLWVSEAKLCHALVFDANSDRSFSERLMIFPIEPDLEFRQMMIESVDEFWGNVQSKVWPEVCNF